MQEGSFADVWWASSVCFSTVQKLTVFLTYFLFLWMGKTNIEVCLNAEIPPRVGPWSQCQLWAGKECYYLVPVCSAWGFNDAVHNSQISAVVLFLQLFSLILCLKKEDKSYGSASLPQLTVLPQELHSHILPHVVGAVGRTSSISKHEMEV